MHTYSSLCPVIYFVGVLQGFWHPAKKAGEDEPAVWDAIADGSAALIPAILIGSLFTVCISFFVWHSILVHFLTISSLSMFSWPHLQVVFQCLYTMLTFIAGANDAGVVSHVKIVPQIALSEVYRHIYIYIYTHTYIAL